MPKSPTAAQLDGIQREITAFLRPVGFRVKGRTYNRKTADGLTHVVNLQMGSFDPPGTTYHPGLRENLYGRFTVNLGVYVPEVARFHGGGEAKSTIHEYHCCVRSRLGELGTERADLWWSISLDVAIAKDVLVRLDQHGLPFLDRFETRDQILEELAEQGSSYSLGGPPRITRAVILATKGEKEAARELLALQAQATQNPGHPAYVRNLVDRLGLRSLDG